MKPTSPPSSPEVRYGPQTTDAPVAPRAPTAEPIVLECDLPHSPALVWRALTEPDLLAAWLLPNDLRPEVGARFSFERPDTPRGGTVDCEVLEVEPHRTLRWRQTESEETVHGRESVTSVVTIELTDDAAGGTHLRLVHDHFALAARAKVVTLAARRSPRARGLPEIVCQLRRAA